MSDRTRDSELSVVEGLWATLDDKALIKDVVMKGKFVSNAIKFIATRNQLKSVEEAKDFFFLEVNDFVRNLIVSKQLHRAIHVLKNVQLNEFFYLYDFYQEEKDGATKLLIFDRLQHLEPEFEEKADVIFANYQLFKLLSQNIALHAKYLENLNRKYSVGVIHPGNIHKIIFGTFMKQPQNWRNEIATDVFFKSQNHHIHYVLDKHCFFAYILRNELYGVLKNWLQEAYICRAGKMIQSTITKPENFESALLALYREWSFEPKMMELIARREKDVIKNEFARLGLFESREEKSVCRKLNRFFTTQTFHDNFQLMKTDQITKFVIENSLMDLLPEKFIDFRYIKLLLENLDVIYMQKELVLVERMRNLLKPETNLEEFLNIVKCCSTYLDDPNESPKLKLVTEALGKLPAKDFNRVADVNAFTQNLAIKMNFKDNKLPVVEDLLEKFHSISLDIIREEFKDESSTAISFDDTKLSSYAEAVTFNHLHAVKQLQSSYGTLLFVREILKNFMTISKSQVLFACEEVAKLAVEDLNNRELITHVMTFLEILSVDSRHLRAYLMLLKLKAFDENEEKDLKDVIDGITSVEDLIKAEAFEIVWKVKKIKNPSRNFLSRFIKSEDWFRILLLSQYLNFSQKSLISICDDRIQKKAMSDNLIRAVMFESTPESKKQCSFSKKRNSKTINGETALFPKGKFLEMKFDLYAILLKCDETTDRKEISFEDFQKLLHQNEASNDLLQEAMKQDWPLVAVIAATTKLYRLKYCWITWLVLSTDFKWTVKYKSTDELSQTVVRQCVENGTHRTLDESLKIFYPHTALKIFSSFLHQSRDGDVDQMEMTLKQFIVQLVNNKYDLVVSKGKEESMAFVIDCIIKHLHCNCKTLIQQKCLEALCRSEISEFSGCDVDFKFMLKLSKILARTNVRVDVELFRSKSEQSFSQVCEVLINENQFEIAIEICDLVNLSKDDFIYKWFIHMWNIEDCSNKHFEAKKYLQLVSKYDVSITVMLRFLKKVVDELEPCAKKFNVMKFIMRNSWIKSSSDLDALEYEIILLFIQLKSIEPEIGLAPLNSEHFESVVSKGKPIIHNSLFELKAIAKIDELSISQKSLREPQEQLLLDELILNLLDAGDIVQVLRIQEMFGKAPEDLKFLVYVMSIAEGINSIYDISKEERKLISSYGLMSNKFNRMALRSLRTSSSNSMSSSPSNDLSESTILDESITRNSFKENKETFQALQGLVCKMKHGTDQAQRIALMYRASLFLNKNFVDLIKMEDSFEILELAASSDCEDKLLVMSDIMIANQMSAIEIADFVAKEVAACIIRTRFLQFTKDTEIMMNSTSSWSPVRTALDDIWGFSLSKEFHLILELCPNTTALGNFLLKYFELLSKEPADIPISSENCELHRICEHLNRMLSPQMISLKKLNIIKVELLISAHESFCHDCNNEGIATILNLSKSLCSQLAAKKSFSLIVKLMCGIGRYREMFYCFDLLMKNEQFETLLGQFSDKQTNSLKLAIMSYLNEYHPQNKEYFKMAASHFMMYTELANIWRSEAHDKINIITSANQIKVMKTGKTVSNQEQQIEIPYFKCNKNLVSELSEGLTSMVHATEMVLRDNKIDLSIKYSSYCELLAVQIHLAKLGCEKEDKLCPNIVSQEQHNIEKLQFLANYELTVPQTLILMKNTDLKIDFAKAIFVHLLMEDDNYLAEYMGRVMLSDEMIEAVVKMCQLDSVSLKQERMLNDLVMMVSHKGLKFRLASLLGLKPLLQSMINDQGTYYYLLDSKYGTVDI